VLRNREPSVQQTLEHSKVSCDGRRLERNLLLN